MRWPLKHMLLCFVFLVLFTGKSEKLFSQKLDYKVYTVFVYNFIKYVEWPPSEGDFIIGIVGDSPIKKELEELAKAKKPNGKKIILLNVTTPNDALLCHLVYVPSTKSSQIKTIADKVKGKSVLIVGEREGLAKKGAAISFVVDDDDVLKFDINRSAINTQNLKISNILVQLGILVG